MSEGAEASAPLTHYRVLQICPHDVAPFFELTRAWVLAGQAAGASVNTVFLGAPSDANQTWDDLDPPARYLESRRLGDTANLARQLAPLAQGHWDLIVCHRYRAYRAAVKAGFEPHRILTIAHEYGLLGRWQRRFFRSLFARRVHFAGVSRSVAEELAGTTGRSLVIPNAVDAQSLRQQRVSRDNALHAMGLESGPFTIGCVGRLHYKKRPDLALDAFQLFLQSDPRARLVFVGEGPMEQQLKRTHQEAQQQVFFTGNLPDARNYLNAFDALLFPAQADSFGMVPLEAMDAGVPVISLREHGPAYVLGPLGIYAGEDTPHGYASALEASRQSDRAELLQLGQARVDQMFSIDALGKVLSHLLTEVG